MFKNTILITVTSGICVCGYSSGFCDMTVHDLPAAVCNPVLGASGKDDRNGRNRKEDYGLCSKSSLKTRTNFGGIPVGFGNLCPRVFGAAPDIYARSLAAGFSGLRLLSFIGVLRIINPDPGFWTKYMQGDACVRLADRQISFFRSLWMEGYLESIRMNSLWHSLSNRLTTGLAGISKERGRDGYFTPSPYFPD